MADVALSELKAFVLIARYRSFRRAAEEAGVSRSSLSHALRSLEQRLGTRLLHRTTRSVALTENGARLFDRLAPTLRDLDDMLAGAGRHGAEIVGALRINASEGGARWLLHRAVPAFIERYPHVTLDMVTEGRLVDIIADGFDAGVRLREAVPQDMIAIPFGGDMRFIAVAAPAYLTAHGHPDIPDDLTQHRCIRQRLPSGKPYRWEFARDGKDVAIEVPGDLTLDNSALMVEAAILGLGIAFVPEAYAREPLGLGQLTELLTDWSPPFPGLCLYYAQNRQVPAVLRAFIDVVRTCA